MSYTKGKWKVRKHGLTYIVYLTREGGGYYEVAKGIYNKDNAHLIAAAPDTYKGLQDALRTICQLCVRLNPQHKNCTSCEEMERSRLPLAEVEGK